MTAKFDTTKQRQRLEALLATLERRTGKVERDLGTAFSRDSEDRAVELENQEVLEGLEAEGHAQIDQIRAALSRLAAGTYETCADCRKSIPVARLQALPYATTCVACAEKRERAAQG